MAKRAYDEDLFESTKMTFGEHLEELRKCFFKAGIGLALGMVIGLMGAVEVVIGDMKGTFYQEVEARQSRVVQIEVASLIQAIKL